jgi:nickel transport protein
MRRDPLDGGALRGTTPSGTNLMTRPGFVVVALLLVAVPSGQAFGHKLQVFASAEGARIAGSTYFAGGGPASGARIEVRDAQGKLLVELSPDPDGRFTYEAQAPMDHRILAITGDGHRAEWLIAADELTGAYGATSSPETPLGLPIRPDAAMEPTASSPAASTVLDPTLEAAIERAVARQIRPLREELVAAENRVRLQDILGGIGYILGLTGLALWWRSRRRPDKR